MRVLFITTFPPRRCGIGDYAADLASALARNHRTELRVLTYPDGFPRGVRLEDGIEVSRNLDRTLSRRCLASELRAFEPDLVHMQSSSFLHSSSVNKGVAAACKVPLVTTVHDAPVSWRVFYVVRGLREVYSRSASIFVLSESAASALAGFHHVDTSKIIRLPFAVDLERYSPAAPTREALTAYGLGGRRIVLFFGFIRPRKGLETLLVAWSKIHALFPDALLVLAGGTPSVPMRYDLLLRSEADYPSKIRQLAAHLGIARRVTLTGYVPRSTLPGLLAASELIVLPYDGGVAQSAPLHQALASGRAIVASDVPGFREVLADGERGVLVPPGDSDALAQAIRHLLENPSRARQLEGRAHAKAEMQLGLSPVAFRTIEVYESILRSPAPLGLC